MQISGKREGACGAVARLAQKGHTSSPPPLPLLFIRNYMEIINLEEYGRKIWKLKNNPRGLDSLNVELTGWYAYYSEQMINLEAKEAQFWKENKHLDQEKPLSDTTIKALWRITPDGADHLRADRYCKTIEKIMSSLKSSLRRLEMEGRNQS